MKYKTIKGYLYKDYIIPDEGKTIWLSKNSKSKGTYGYFLLQKIDFEYNLLKELEEKRD